MESRMREIRTYGLTRGKSHHAPQKLRFGGYIAEATRSYDPTAGRFA